MSLSISPDEPFVMSLPAPKSAWGHVCVVVVVYAARRSLSMLKTTQSATVPDISSKFQSVPAFFIDPEGIAMIWRRDMVRLWRQRSRLLGAVARALVWPFTLGFGLLVSLGSIACFVYDWLDVLGVL